MVFQFNFPNVVIIATAVVFVALSTLVSNLISRYGDLDSCPFSLEGEDRSDCLRKYDQEKMRVDTIRFLVLVSFGIVALFVAYREKNQHVRNSLALGGLGSIVMGVLMNWNQMGQYLKIGFISAALLGLLNMARQIK